MDDDKEFSEKEYEKYTEEYSSFISDFFHDGEYTLTPENAENEYPFDYMLEKGLVTEDDVCDAVLNYDAGELFMENAPEEFDRAVRNYARGERVRAAVHAAFGENFGYDSDRDMHAADLESFASDIGAVMDKYGIRPGSTEEAEKIITEIVTGKSSLSYDIVSDMENALDERITAPLKKYFDEEIERAESKESLSELYGADYIPAEAGDFEYETLLSAATDMLGREDNPYPTSEEIESAEKRKDVLETARAMRNLISDGKFKIEAGNSMYRGDITRGKNDRKLSAYSIYLGNGEMEEECGISLASGKTAAAAVSEKLKTYFSLGIEPERCFLRHICDKTLHYTVTRKDLEKEIENIRAKDLSEKTGFGAQKKRKEPETGREM